MENEEKGLDLNGAAVYGIRVAKLKLAYESAYSILDKLALFLNDYNGIYTIPLRKSSVSIGCGTTRPCHETLTVSKLIKRKPAC